MSLTQIRELDRLILMDLDDLTLTQACQVNQWIHWICSDDSFWRERLQRRFGHKIVSLKKPEESYHQMYIRLAQLVYTEEQAEASAYEGHLDELLVLKQADVPMEQDVFDEAVRGGHLDIVEWGLANTAVDPYQLMATAARWRRLDMMKWLNRRHGIIMPEIIWMTLRQGTSEMLDWLAELGYVPNARDMDTAMAYANIPAIDWLIQRGIWPTQEQMRNALWRNQQRLVGYMVRKYGLFPEMRAF